jgi:hypothetical protein
MTYAELITCAMRGEGKMPNSTIYTNIRKIAKRTRRKLSPHWRATVRNTLQRHSRQSAKFCPPYLFVHHDRNIWECRK